MSFLALGLRKEWNLGHRFSWPKEPLVPDVEGEEGDVLAEKVTLHPLQPSHDLLRDLVQVLIYSKDTKLRRISLHVTDALLQSCALYMM